MIVGISTMQVHEDSRPSYHNPASETSLETDPSAASYPNEESHPPPPHQMHLQHHHHYQGALMPPQQVYVGQDGGQMPDVGMLAHQFQALGMQHQYHHQPPPQQQQQQQQRGGQGAPQSGDSETGDENDGTTETEEDPVKLFVGQVSGFSLISLIAVVIGASQHSTCNCNCHCLKFRIFSFENHD